MIRILSTWLVVALAGGAFVSGCGSSGTSTSSGQEATAHERRLPTVPTAALAADPELQKAVNKCKQGIAGLPTAVPSYSKESLEKVCELDANRGLAGVRRGTVNLCLDGIYNARPPLLGAVRQELFALCKKAAQP